MDENNQEISRKSREITLMQLFLILGESKWVILRSTALAVLLAAAYLFLAPKYYVSSTLVMPPQQQQSAALSGALSQLGMIAGITGGMSGIKTPDELYLVLLKSRTLQDKIISKLDLKNRYSKKLNYEARDKLSESVSITSDKKAGLIKIVSEDVDPVFAAKLANLHVTELRDMLSLLAITEAQQRRMFFEAQVQKAESSLKRAEHIFKDMQGKKGLSVTEVLAEASVKAGVEIRRQIAEREVQLAALRQFATTENPDSKRVAAELLALRAQLRQVEVGGSGLGVVARDDQHADVVAAYREMKIRGAALEALQRQLEISRVEEAKDAPLLQQIDVAVPSEYPQKPKKKVVIIFSVVAGILFGVLKVIFNRGRSSERMHDLKTAWSLKRSQ